MTVKNYKEFLGRYDLNLKYISSSDLKYKLGCIKQNLVALCNEEDFILQELFRRHEKVEEFEFISYQR